MPSPGNTLSSWLQWPVRSCRSLRYRVHGGNTIREGSSQGLGQGLMRFEVLWVVARHAPEACARYRERGRDPHPPAAYDALINPDHPYRRAAVSALG